MSGAKLTTTALRRIVAEASAARHSLYLAGGGEVDFEVTEWRPAAIYLGRDEYYALMRDQFQGSGMRTGGLHMGPNVGEQTFDGIPLFEVKADAHLFIAVELKP